MTTATAPGATPTSTRDHEFAAIAMPLLPHVARVARALTRDESAAEELVQETYLRAYRHWHTFQRGTDCRRWLSRICRNASSDATRRDRLERTIDDAELESLAVADVHTAASAVGLGDMYSRLELGPAILDAISRLEPTFRDIVVLSDIEEMGYDEIAELLGIPSGTVRSRLYRARRVLQESLVAYALNAGFGIRKAQR